MTRPMGAQAGDDGAPLLAVRGLKKHFMMGRPLLERIVSPGGMPTVKAVDGLDFDIPRGQTLSIVGESGCGKSTVARLIMGLSQPSAGSIRFDGTELADQPAGKPAALRRRMQMIFQDPYASLNPRWRIRDIIAEPLRVFGVIPGALRRRAEVDRLLEFVGLGARDGDRFPHELSGGQRQRISIARAISTKPDFLVCDEPTSALDVSVQAQILNLLRDMQRELGLTYFFISHDLSVVNFVSDWIGVMYLGRLVEIAPAATLFENPKHPYTRMLLETVPDLKDPKRDRVASTGEIPNPIDPPPGCHFNPRCRYADDRCRMESPNLVEHPGLTKVACHYPANLALERAAM